jgi:hypothetical protein
MAVALVSVNVRPLGLLRVPLEPKQRSVGRLARGALLYVSPACDFRHHDRNPGSGTVFWVGAHEAGLEHARQHFVL